MLHFNLVADKPSCVGDFRTWAQTPCRIGRAGWERIAIRLHRNKFPVVGRFVSLSLQLWRLFLDPADCDLVAMTDLMWVDAVNWGEAIYCRQPPGRAAHSAHWWRRGTAMTKSQMSGDTFPLETGSSDFLGVPRLNCEKWFSSIHWRCFCRGYNSKRNS